MDQKQTAGNTITAKKGLPPLWWAPVARLKSERVQDGLTVRLSQRQADGLMPLLPGWQLAANGRAVERTREFATEAVALLYAAFVTGFAETLGITSRVSVSGPEVVVRLYSLRSHGRVAALSEGILGLAKLLG